jgi:RNA polymerase sigma factor (sigma-70 family)
MGRSGRQTARAGTPALPPQDAGSDRNRELRAEVEALMHRSRRGGACTPRARAAALGVLPHGRQALLVEAATSYEGPRQQRVRENAVELLLLTNAGFIERFARRFGARGLAAEVLRQECETGLVDAIPRFRPEIGASFLTFASTRMRARISAALRTDARLVRLPRQAEELATKVELERRALEAKGAPVSVERVAANLDAPAELVREVWGWVVEGVASLDTPVGSEDGNTLTLAGTVADTLDVGEDVVGAELRARLRELVASLAPGERFAVERLHALGADDELVAARLTAAVSDTRGLELVLLDPATLEGGFAAGRLAIDEGTPAADELADLLGVPPNTRTLETLLARAYRKLEPSLRDLRETVAYRGVGEIEHSSSAQEAVRAELRRRVQEAGGLLADPDLGSLTIGAVNRMKPRGGLRVAAQNAGLVDGSGRLTFERARAAERVATPANAPTAKPVLRRRTLQEMLHAGDLAAGEQIHAVYKGIRHEAQITADGTVRFPDGREFTSLSSAARAVSREENGWAFWKSDRGGQPVPLGRLRDRAS